MKKGYNSIYLISMVFVFAMSGCSTFLKQPMKTKEATLGYSTPQKSTLQSLPEPREQIVCAVYNFRDQTGQYKPSETGASWSTAVTQGATSVLMKALEESGWFVIIERENISNLLNERKIIRSSRQQYGASNSNQRLLPPLLYAGIILEGGIISYESNIRTGGAGLRYFGAGGSGEYREDRVSIYLRAVSSSNGKVLKTVYTTKSILSQKVNASLFRYVKLKRLLEAETGFTYNEPSHMAVKEAIEKAVVSLIAEGVEDNLWSTNNPSDSLHKAFTDIKLEKENLASSNAMGIKQFSNQRNDLFIGAEGGLTTYDGDYENSSMKGTTNVSFGMRLSKYWFLNLKGGYAEYHVDNRFSQTMLSGDLGINFKLLPDEKITPQVAVGLGLAHFDGLNTESSDMLKPYVTSEAGFELMLHRNIGLHATGSLNYLLSDKTDGVEAGEYNDLFMTTKVGLNFYLGN